MVSTPLRARRFSPPAGQCWPRRLLHRPWNRPIERMALGAPGWCLRRGGAPFDSRSWGGKWLLLLPLTQASGALSLRGRGEGMSWPPSSRMSFQGEWGPLWHSPASGLRGPLSAVVPGVGGPAGLTVLLTLPCCSVRPILSCLGEHSVDPLAGLSSLSAGLWPYLGR